MTDGGVRHGTDPKAAVTVGQNEARLFCNLIRSYINYLIAEYERLMLNFFLGDERLKALREFMQLF